jgi:GntR family transcriptional regulator
MMQRPRQALNAKDGKPLPIYFRLQDIILREIESGRLSPGSTIPPERKLAESYGVSIGTVKKALLNLVNEGYLYRIQGKGTFVTGTTLRRESLRYYRLFKQFDDDERALSVHLTGIRRIPGTQQVNTPLRIKVGQTLFELKRVFCFKESPVIFSVSYLPVQLFRGIDKISASCFEQKTLFAIIEEKFGLPTIYNRELIGANLPPPEVSQALKIRKNHPVLYVEMLAFTYRDRPYEYRRAYCVTNLLKIFRQY